MHFIITFGFSISTKSDENVAKDKVKKKSEREGKKKKISKDTTEIAEAAKNVIRVGEVLAEVHVEYELLPNYNFKFDCRCWETGAKIYTEKDDWCLRPIPCPIKENTCWVLFSIHHVVQLNEIQIKNLFNYVIICHVYLGKEKLSERSKKDKVKEFYIDDEHINAGPEEFIRIYPFDIYQSNSPILPTPESTIVTDKVYGDFSITTYPDVLPDCIHAHKFWKMLRKNRFPPDCMKCETFVTSDELKKENAVPGKHESSRERGSSKKSRKEKRESGSNKVQVVLPAKVFFSDMGIITSYNRLPQSSISSILIYAQCQDILPYKRLRMNLNPVSIKLERLSNLPISPLIENGIEWIYAKISFVHHTILTPCYAPSVTMCLEFVKCFLYKDFKADELINFLATKFLTVEVIGIRRTGTIVPPSSTSERRYNDASMMIKSSTFPEIQSNEEKVLLGIAEFDLSNLLRGFWEVKLSNSLIHPRNKCWNSTDYTNGDGEGISWKNSPLAADTLMSFCTSVKIKVRTACDLRMVQRNVLRRENILNRIFLRLDDAKLAGEILAEVYSHNLHLLGTYKELNENKNSQVQSALKHILTGFVIESRRRIYIFLEGLSGGYLLKVWKRVSELGFSHKCVYYNSDYVFLARLFEEFVPHGGVIHIKLRDSLDRKLREYALYIGQTRTTHRAIAIRKIGLINLTSTMKSLCQKRLCLEPNDVKAFIDACRQQFENTSC